MINDNEKIMSVIPAIVFLALLIILIIKVIVPSIHVSELVAPFATLIAAYVGAKYAFEMQTKKETEEKKNKQISSINQTLCKIGIMWSNLYQYKKQAIEVVKDKPAPWLCLKHAFTYVEVNIPYEDLPFLLDNRKHTDYYLKILNIQQCYNVTCGTIQSLWKANTEELQPKMEQLGYGLGPFDPAVLEEQLGPVLVSKLKDLTMYVITNVPIDMEDLKEFHKEFRAAMAEKYGDHFIRALEFSD